MPQASRFVDLTQVVAPDTLAWDSPDGLGQFRQVKASPAKGDAYTASVITLPTHEATHVRRSAPLRPPTRAHC